MNETTNDESIRKRNEIIESSGWELVNPQQPGIYKSSRRRQRKLESTEQVDKLAELKREFDVFYKAAETTKNREE